MAAFTCTSVCNAVKLSASTPATRASAPAPMQACSSAFMGAAMPARMSTRTTSGRGALCVRANTLEAGVGLMGNKAGMTQIFTEEGVSVPVTVISLNDGNVVTQVKTEDSDGYTAVQVGYGLSKEKHVSKPELGHLAKSGAPPLRHLTEFRVKSVEGYEAGQQLDFAEMFAEGDLCDVQGTSVGKGFQGGIKRWGFKRGLMTHGSKSHREHGSTGPGSTPGRVFPGLKAAGQMGNKTAKERKLQIVRVDAENKCILVKGSVPGKPGGLLRIAPSKIVGKNV
mmetsp:Transcript_33999/g.74398  ORF Transcript_33999/g.74398 Transcript_33999/m.74398 type:complete len:281 (-) Transcript_33999:356-1198(-)|eukprot:CAMPEP_0118932110 /NCGR_PEP_ID=MMETSP1169-20130426/9133_1 /TAXON_ID=36882 /ORGANISM="Pyramimonas obovata, Strain CCMP722" /LENGTH=280 /DNA_ID=CAMNT_0006874715 /DNA_START=78 /DNA_END=920 /DNA_ORIENTATION=+